MSDPVTESIRISAAAQDVYDLVSDVSRMGEWSPEATGAVRANKQLQAGDTFVGLNRFALARWWTNCTVLHADRGERFGFDVDFGPMPVSRWTYEFSPQPDGSTEVSETWIDRRNGLMALPVRLAGRVVIPGDRAVHNRANMRVTLKRLKAHAEAPADGPGVSQR